MGAAAIGTNSIALGAGATAAPTNSVAIGPGATATRPNQVVIGTANSTYTMPGITSAASKAAQTSPFPKNQSNGSGVRVVTTDMAGNLADPPAQELGLATQSQINKLTEGVATVASLAQPILLPGQHFAMRAGWGGFDASNAVGFSAAGVLANNVVRPGYGTLVVDGGVGVGTDEGEVTGRAGMTFGW